MSARLPDEVREAYVAIARDSFGLVFPGSRLEALDDGVLVACTSLGISDPRELLQLARAGDGAALVALADALTVGETYFFRDPQHFALVRRVLETRTDPVILWSAGCASGAEPYSMAIVAREVYGDDAPRRVQVLGTDLSPEALTAARTGRYRPWAFRGTDEALRTRWFVREGNLLRVADEIRDLVKFRRLNLLDTDDEAWPTGVAVAFCRNVLVYFSDDAIARAAAGLRRSLTDDGLLVTGPSDPLLTAHGLAIEPSAGFLAYRRGTATPPAAMGPPPPPPRPATPPATAPERPSPKPPEAPIGAPPPVAPPQAEPAPAEPKPADEALAHARALADRGDSAGALAATDDAIRDDPLKAEGYLLRALLRQGSGHHRMVLQDTRRALLLDRGLIYAHVVAAPSAWVLGDRERARRSLRNARAALAKLPPETEVAGAGASAAEVLSACLQMEAAVRGGDGG